MKIDWFDFWLIFSWILLIFLLIGVLFRFFQWIKFRKELAYIKQQKVKDIVKIQKTNPKLDESFLEISWFKREIDNLMKDIYFDSYDKNMPWESEFFGVDLEWSLDKLLDGKILDLIKEKDYLLQQKDSIIWSIEERNKKTLKDVVNKVFFVLVEKDKMLREKDLMITNLKSKIQEIETINLEKYITKLPEIAKERNSQKDNSSYLEKKPNDKKIFYSHTDFINVNSVERK